MKIRTVLATLHLWCGLLTFLLLVPIGWTGIALAWPQQVAALLNPPPHAVGQASKSLSDYVAAGQSALGDRARIGSVTLPSRQGEPVAVATAQRRGPPQPGVVSGVAWLEPSTGRLLKTGPVNSPLIGPIHQFHENLMAGRGGRSVVGWLGVVMFGLSLSGLWLWWPRGALAKGFAFRRTVSTLLNLHYTVGFWICIPLAIVSLTGVGLSFPFLVGGRGEPPRAAAPGAESGGREGGERRGGERGGPAGAHAGKLSFEQAAAVALASDPGARLLSVTAPGGPGGGWRVQVDEGGRRKALAVDDASGQVAPAAPAGPPGGGLMGIVRGLHEGDGNLIWKWLVTLTGLAPTLFGVTGLLAWLRSQRRKRVAGQSGAGAKASQ